MKIKYQRLVWVLLTLNVLILMVVIQDWRADQVRQMSGSVQGLASGKVREIVVVARDTGELDRKGLVSVGAENAIVTDSSVDEPVLTDSFQAGPVETMPQLTLDCDLIGPFTAPQRLKIASLTLDMTAATWITKEIPRPRPTLGKALEYRVYTGPAESLEAAYQARKYFRNQGLDSYVMTDGPLAQGISLGVFSSLGAAERFIGQLSVSEQLKISAPVQGRVDYYLRLVGGADRAEILRQADLLTPSVGRKPCGSAQS